MAKEFDYIIVGAGSAGCVLANRLSAGGGASVLLLEAGGWDRDPLIHIPLGWGIIFKERRHDWGYDCEPEPSVDGRAVECARGKLVGGCSSTNAMAWVRGSTAVYDAWGAEPGLEDWSAEGVLPYFKRQESWEDGADDWRGSGGPVRVQRCRYEDPLVDAFGAAGGREFGWTEDYNGAVRDGFGRLQMSIRRGIRASTSNAYLRPVTYRRSLTVRTGTMLREITFDKDRAAGVVVTGRSGEERLSARREVILSAGVINTPKILKLCGIGPESELREHGIDLRVSSPGVGANLMDHPSIILMYHRGGQSPFHRMMRYDRIVPDLARTYFGGEGFSGDVPGGVTAFLRSSHAKTMPDIQFLFTAAPLAAWPYMEPFRKPFADGFATRLVLTQPQSRGEVLLASADPAAAPRIRQNFFSHDADLTILREGFEIARSLAASAEMAPFVKAEVAPGPDCTSSEAIDAYARKSMITVHHPAGTCRMGAASDDRAVVGPDLKVHGVEGLRVVDASVFPHIPNGNINAAVIMVAEKAADMIAAEPG